MKPLAPLLASLLLLVAPSIAALPKDTEPASVEKDVLDEKSAPAQEPALDDYTTFNDMKVPLMKELNGDNFEEEAKEGYW